MRGQAFKRCWLVAVLAAGCGGGAAAGGGQGTTAAGGGKAASPAGGPAEQSVAVGAPGDPAAAPAAAPAAPRDAQWDSAIGYFNESEKTGWNGSRCEEAAEKFVAAGKGKRADAFFNAGVAYQKCGKLADAERHYKQALALDANYAPAMGALGELAFRAGRRDEAVRLWKQAIDKDARLEVTAARVNLAALAYEQIRATSVAATRAQLEKEAIGHLQRTLAIDNDNIVAYTLMALIYMEGSERNRNRLDVAELLITEGKKRNDRYAPLWNASGILKMKRGNVAKALEDFRQAVQLDPRLAEARMNVGQIVLSSRNYDEAETQFREVLAMERQSYEALIGLGVALRGQATVARAAGKSGEFDAKIKEAEDTYNKAIAVDRNRPDAYYNLGLLYKDYRTNSEDQSKNIAQYRRAKQYFQDYLARVDKSDEKRDDAQGHIQDCDKYVDILTKAMASK
jgi:tetratricopeptide (TPR) repeat protein